VVTYKTILNVNNDDLSLRPGMTATAEIVTAERENVLLAPNAALRFTPPPTEAESKPGGGLLASLMPRPPRGMGGRRSPRVASDKKGGRAKLWVLRDGQPVAVPVTVGSDGRMTEVSGEGLAGYTGHYRQPEQLQNERIGRSRPARRAAAADRIANRH
jgi:HlyD family secretion protein